MMQCLDYYKKHLEKYPKMQIEDKIKLIMQGIMGPGHLVNNPEYVFGNLLAEYQMIKDLNLNDLLVEEISEDYVRVYLKPYFHKTLDFTKLINAFVNSSKYETNKVKLYQELEELKKIETEENQKIIDDYIKSGNVLIRHSNIYREEYSPHYLVIHKKELKKSM